MIITSIGTIRSHVKNTYLRTKADLKMRGIEIGDPQALNNTGKTNQKDSGRIMRIKNKLLSGEPLTPDEMAYLREYAPDLYSKAKQIESDRKEFSSKLKSCNSKEEARLAKTTRVINFSSQALGAGYSQQSVDDNEFAIMRIRATDNVYSSFTKSWRYAKLEQRSKNSFLVRHDTVDIYMKSYTKEKEEKKKHNSSKITKS